MQIWKRFHDLDITENRMVAIWDRAIEAKGLECQLAFRKNGKLWAIPNGELLTPGANTTARLLGWYYDQWTAPDLPVAEPSGEGAVE